MKKILTITAALLFCRVAFAQIGIIGGLTSSSTKVNVVAQELASKSLSQYHVGVTYKLELGNRFALQPALIYNVKGAKISEFTGISDIDFKTGYVELPVQFQAGLSLASIVRIYGMVEPFIGVAVSNLMKMSGSTDRSWDNVKNRFEYGCGVGLGVELFKRVQVSARYFWNFNPIYGHSITEGSTVYKISDSKSKGITLSAVVFLK